MDRHLDHEIRRAVRHHLQAIAEFINEKNFAALTQNSKTTKTPRHNLSTYLTMDIPHQQHHQQITEVITYTHET
ncbi:MAG: hypothetical protein AAF441_22300, partial [Pseudomonadota bacterium]